MKIEHIQFLLTELKEKPWPRLARSVGDFALYETLLVGVATSLVQGEPVSNSTVPESDDETLRWVNEARAKSEKTSEEAEFLSYFSLLERLRGVILESLT